MKKFLKSKNAKIILCIISALCLGLIISAMVGLKSSPFTLVGSVVYKPIQKAGTFISDKMRDFKTNFVSSGTYKEQISELTNEVNEMNAKLVDYERTKQKLESYRSFLNIKEDNPDYKYVDCSVISRTKSDSMNTMTLDKGSASGIKVNDPVVFGDALVGVVRRVSSTTCTVKTILDPNVSVSVYEIKSRENGYISSSSSLSSSSQCSLSGLDSNTAVSGGGIVCTSGLGGIYPRDLIVGTVTQMKESDNDATVYGIVEPQANVNSLSDVFVITYFDGQGQ